MEVRLAALEQEVAGLRQQLVTERLIVVDGQGRERVVARASDDATELRVLLEDFELLLFAVHGRGGWTQGAGLQVWASGQIVHERAWWGDAS